MLETPENEGFVWQKRTKTSILYSGGLTPACHRGATLLSAASGQLFAMPPRGNSPLCRLGATVRDAASGQLSSLPPSGNSPPCRRVRTLGPGSAVAERNLGAARPLRNVIVAAYPLRNVIVAAYPLRNVNGSRLSVAKRNRCAAGLLFMLPFFRIFEFLCD